MKLLLVRHARAEERREIPGPDGDATRRLTDGGRRDMRKAAKGFARFAPDLELLATSPLERARETARILTRVLGGPDPVELALLAPGSPREELLAWLGTQPVDSAVMLVGHEPDLGQLASWLLGGGDRSFIEFKKGAVCMLDFESHPQPGGGRLLWSLAPGQLRALAIARD